MMQNIDKFAARQARPIFINTRSNRSHMSYRGVLKILAEFKELVLESLFNKVEGLRPVPTGVFL